MENNKTYKFVKNKLGKPFKRLFRIKVEGTENIPKKGKIVLAGNHRCMLDPCVCITSCNREIHFLAKDTFYDKLIFKNIFKKMGCIRVITKTHESNMGALEGAIEELNKGNVVGIFPEGTRNKTNKTLLKFRKGVSYIAIESNSKVVPFAITGKYKLFSKDLTISYGKPIDVSKLSKKEASEFIKSKVEELIINKINSK